MSVLFFCAIGGSGMMPLALIMKARGSLVSGSDRGRDQGRAPERFAFLEEQGIRLYPQDGSGISPELTRVVVSTAVEDTVPDVCAARRMGIPVTHRADLLAEIFNASRQRIGVAGTSGKSTTTGMIAWILDQAGLTPTVMNGAVMKNFVTEERPFASALVGDADLFVSEVDESDGSIELYHPTVAVLNNIAFDHKTLEDLRGLFSRFIGRAQHVVINLDNEEAALLARASGGFVTTYSLSNPSATLYADSVTLGDEGARFRVHDTRARQSVEVCLPLAGRHNVSNALAAMGAALAAGVGFEAAARALETFMGIARRLERVGETGGVVVYDDFAHNPDKVGASLKALHQGLEGRVLVLFQPHGYGPLKMMKEALAEAFALGLAPQDRLHVTAPLYLGGTVERSVSSEDFVASLSARGVQALHHDSREAAAQALLREARPGDRLVIMGARDDTLPAFAKNLLKALEAVCLR